MDLIVHSQRQWVFISPRHSFIPYHHLHDKMMLGLNKGFEVVAAYDVNDSANSVYRHNFDSPCYNKVIEVKLIK